MQPRWMKPLLAGSLFLALAAPIRADSFPTVASGEGASREIALSSALRHAVEQVVGMNVSTNLQVQNLKQINDKIYSTAEGFIETYEVVDEVRVPNGGYRVTVSAKVSKEKLSQAVAPITGNAQAFDGKVALANFDVAQSNEAAMKEELIRLLEEADEQAIKYTFDTKIEPCGNDLVELTVSNVRMSIDNDWVDRRWRPFHKDLVQKFPELLKLARGRLVNSSQDLQVALIFGDAREPLTTSKEALYSVIHTLLSRDLPPSVNAQEVGFYGLPTFQLSRRVVSNIAAVKVTTRVRELMQQ